MVKKGLKSIQVYGQDLHENTRNRGVRVRVAGRREERAGGRRRRQTRRKEATTSHLEAAESATTEPVEPPPPPRPHGGRQGAAGPGRGLDGRAGPGNWGRYRRPRGRPAPPPPTPAGLRALGLSNREVGARRAWGFEPCGVGKRRAWGNGFCRGGLRGALVTLEWAGKQPSPRRVDPLSCGLVRAAGFLRFGPLAGFPQDRASLPSFAHAALHSFCSYVWNRHPPWRKIAFQRGGGS
jgi:hypothetical protein